MFGSPSPTLLPAFIAPVASLHSFIAPADTAAGVIPPAYAAQQPPVGPASVIDALAVPTSNSDAAVVVTMANIAPNTVTINHARLLELLIKEAAHDEAHKKAFQDAINLSQPSPPKSVADVNECHFANIFPELAGELSIFSPTNYRSRHSQTDPHWKDLRGYPFTRVQKT